MPDEKRRDEEEEENFSKPTSTIPRRHPFSIMSILGKDSDSGSGKKCDENHGDDSKDNEGEMRDSDTSMVDDIPARIQPGVPQIVDGAPYQCTPAIWYPWFQRGPFNPHSPQDHPSAKSPGSHISPFGGHHTSQSTAHDRKSPPTSPCLKSDDDDDDDHEIEIADDDDDEMNTSENNSENSNHISNINNPRKKKTRTVFSRSQVFQLESTFDMKRYLSSSERSGLANSLHLSEQQVKIWFQNRRNKWKRQLTAEMEAANMAHAAHAQRMVRVPVLYHEGALHGSPEARNSNPFSTGLSTYSHLYYPGTFPGQVGPLRPNVGGLV